MDLAGRRQLSYGRCKRNFVVLHGGGGGGFTNSLLLAIYIVLMNGRLEYSRDLSIVDDKTKYNNIVADMRAAENDVYAGSLLRIVLLQL